MPVEMTPKTKSHIHPSFAMLLRAGFPFRVLARVLPAPDITAIGTDMATKIDVAGREASVVLQAPLEWLFCKRGHKS